MSAEEILDEWERLAEEATEAPWQVAFWPGASSTGDVWVEGPTRRSAPGTVSAPGVALVPGEFEQTPDAEFIAASRTGWPAATAILRALLDLHKRHHHVAGHPGLALGPDTCLHDGREWPCPTVRIITRILEQIS